MLRRLGIHNLVILCSSAPGPLNASLNFLEKLACKYLYLNVYLHAVVVNLRAIFSPPVSRVLEARPLVCQQYHVTHQTITQKVRLRHLRLQCKVRHLHCRIFALSDIWGRASALVKVVGREGLQPVKVWEDFHRAIHPLGQLDYKSGEGVGDVQTRRLHKVEYSNRICKLDRSETGEDSSADCSHDWLKKVAEIAGQFDGFKVRQGL